MIDLHIRFAGPGRAKDCSSCREPLAAWGEQDPRPLCSSCIEKAKRDSEEARQRHAAWIRERQEQAASDYAEARRTRLAKVRTDIMDGQLSERLGKAAEFADGFVDTFGSNDYDDGRGPDEYAEAEALAVRDLLTGLKEDSAAMREALAAWDGAHALDYDEASAALAEAVRKYLGEEGA